MVICFSHNDEKPDPARHTDPADTFPAYLLRYIETARQAGAEPVLATPIARRHFDGQGVLTATHGDYPDAIRKLAGEQGLPLADLEKATMRLFRAEGPEGTKAIFCHLPAGTPNYPEGAADNSHLQEDGAARIARLFLDLLKCPEQDQDDEPYVKAEDCDNLIAREDSVVDR